MASNLEHQVQQLFGLLRDAQARLSALETPDAFAVENYWQVIELDGGERVESSPEFDFGSRVGLGVGVDLGERL